MQRSWSLRFYSCLESLPSSSAVGARNEALWRAQTSSISWYRELNEAYKACQWSHYLCLIRVLVCSPHDETTSETIRMIVREILRAELREEVEVLFSRTNTKNQGVLPVRTWTFALFAWCCPTRAKHHNLRWKQLMKAPMIVWSYPFSLSYLDHAWLLSMSLDSFDRRGCFKMMMSTIPCQLPSFNFN